MSHYTMMYKNGEHICVFFLGLFVLLYSSFIYFGDVFNKTIIPIRLVGYDMIIAIISSHIQRAHGIIVNNVSRNRLAPVNDHLRLTFCLGSYGSFDCMKVRKSMFLLTYYRSNIILHINREFKITTTATAMGTSLNKRFNE